MYLFIFYIHVFINYILIITLQTSSLLADKQNKTGQSNYQKQFERIIANGRYLWWHLLISFVTFFSHLASIVQGID